MLRAYKGADWGRHLLSKDLAYLQGRVSYDDWYPMDTFERMGLAILAEVARGDMSLVQAWGRGQIDPLAAMHPQLVVVGNPAETLMRFQVLRQSFFDYAALEIRELGDAEATVDVNYGMGAVAEEAACFQTLGFFERLLEASGATHAKASFSRRSWEGADATTIVLAWKA